MKRRTFLLAAASLPFVTLVAHEHTWQPEVTWFGYSCSCGATISAKELRRMS